MSLKYPMKGKKWTLQEENVILNMFHSHTVDDIADVLQRLQHTVVDKMRKMKIKKEVLKGYMIEIFTINEVKFKIINYNLGLGRNYYALKSRGLCKTFETKSEALDYAKFWVGDENNG